VLRSAIHVRRKIRFRDKEKFMRSRDGFQKSGSGLAAVQLETTEGYLQYTLGGGAFVGDDQQKRKAWRIGALIAGKKTFDVAVFMKGAFQSQRGGSGSKTLSGGALWA